MKKLLTLLFLALGFAFSGTQVLAMERISATNNNEIVAQGNINPFDVLPDELVALVFDQFFSELRSYPQFLKEHDAPCYEPWKSAQSKIAAMEMAGKHINVLALVCKRFNAIINDPKLTHSIVKGVHSRLSQIIQLSTLGTKEAQVKIRKLTQHPIVPTWMLLLIEGDFKGIRVLLKNGVDPNLRKPDWHCNLFSMAIGQGKYTAAKELLLHNAYISEQPTNCLLDSPWEIVLKRHKNIQFFTLMIPRLQTEELQEALMYVQAIKNRIEPEINERLETLIAEELDKRGNNNNQS